MEMTRELYDRIQETAQVQVIEINGRKYTTSPVNFIDEPRYSPKQYEVNTLSGLISMILTEVDKIKNLPLIVNVHSYDEVEVCTTYGDRFERWKLYVCAPNLPRNSIGDYISHEEFMIELRSKFIRNEDVEYLLKLLSSVVDENKVESRDNGLTQSVEVKQGITTIGDVVVKPIVKLKPYRTFLEVEQPESEFIVRLRDGGKIALFEADGGMWKLKAKSSISSYLCAALIDLIKCKKVVVTE